MQASSNSGAAAMSFASAGFLASTQTISPTAWPFELSIKSTFVERASLRCQGAGVCVMFCLLQGPKPRWFMQSIDQWLGVVNGTPQKQILLVLGDLIRAVLLTLACHLCAVQ
jgi:hypothetical protein